MPETKLFIPSSSVTKTLKIIAPLSGVTAAIVLGGIANFPRSAIPSSDCINAINFKKCSSPSFNLTNANRSLTFTNGALSNGKNDVIKLTGTLAANRTVSIPDSIEKVYNVQNACDHAGNTLTFKTSSGTGVLLCEGNCYVLYSDGTNIVKQNEYKKWRVVTANETVQAGAQLLVNTNGGAVTIRYLRHLPLAMKYHS